MLTAILTLESLQQQSFILDLSADSVLVHDLDGNIVFANKSAYESRGYMKKELIGMNLSKIIIPEQNKLFSHRISELLRMGQLRFESTHIRKDGSVFSTETQVKLIEIEDNKYCCSVIRDITERKRSEVELQMSKSLLSSAFNKNPLLMTISDMATGKYLDVNDSFCKVSEFSREEAVGKTSVELGWISGVERERLARELKKNGQVIGLELNFRSKNKTRVICRFAGEVIKTTEGDRLFSTAEVITAQKQEENRVKTILRMAMDGFYLVDMEGRILETNDSYCSMIGYSGEELLKMSVKDVEAVETEEVIKKRIRQIVETGYARFETKHKRKDGRVIDIEASVNYLSKKPAKFFCFMRDITDRKRTEEALLYFQMAVGGSTDAIGMATPAGRHYYQNEAYTKLFGLSVSEVDGVSGPPATVYADEKVGRTVFDIIMKGSSFVGEVKMLDKDRKERDIYLRAYSIKNNEGKVVGLVGLHNDVTEQRQAEQKLRKSESQLRESQKIAKLGSWDLDLVSQVLYWSNETYKLFDKSPDNFMPSFHEFARLVHPNDLDRMQTNFDNALKSDDPPYHVVVRIINDSGREWVMEAFGAVRRDASGKAVSIFGTTQDITERKQTEEKIRQSEEFIRSILDTVDEGFIVIDQAYRILTANKAFCGHVGLGDKKVIGQHCYEISHRLSRPCYEDGEECATRRVFETGKPHSVLHLHKDAHDNLLYVETKAFPIKDESGTVISVIETLNNITEKHLLEEERLKTQKLESIGTLAGGIAHDFNNLLQGVFGYISLAKMTSNNRDKSTAALEQAEKALYQSVNLTTQLLTFSKGGKPIKKLVDLRPVIENSAKFTLSGSRSDLRMDIPEDLWQVEADGGQLGQVIQNIVLNADQSMPIGGTVKVSSVNIAKGNATLPPGLAQGDYVMIAIQDSGVGIPEQYRSKIFDPYFTTKDKGSGLGLATSYSIVRNHGGMIDIKTKSGVGSTFTIYLPAIVRQARTESVEKQQLSTQSGRARILVMDDDEVIRNLSIELLGLLGHDVEVAKHGQEAIEKYQGALAGEIPFDIVILDLTVRGGMGGVETVQQLLKMDPQVKAVVSSGYSDDAAIANYMSQGFRASLKKPYDVDALREVINKLLIS
jgi:two-component system, cell cycle sensor histidine kinase and response regulator CckA